METVLENSQVNKQKIRRRVKTVFLTDGTTGSTKVVAYYADTTYLDGVLVLIEEGPTITVDAETLLAHMPSFPELQEAFDRMIADLNQ